MAEAGVRSVAYRAGRRVKTGRDCLRTHCRRLAECAPKDFWQGQLHMLLDALDQAFCEEKGLERKLEQLAKSDQSVRPLMTIPGVGRCTAEVICAYIDDPRRFSNGRQVSSYAGLVPVQYQSGNGDRRGRITKLGSRLLRKSLVECSWLMLRYNSWAIQLMQRISKGQKTRRKQAVVAVARRLLVRCWAMLRDGTDWAWKPEPATSLQVVEDASQLHLGFSRFLVGSVDRVVENDRSVAILDDSLRNKLMSQIRVAKQPRQLEQNKDQSAPALQDPLKAR